MILTEFSKTLQQRESDIINGTSVLELLVEWIKEILSRKPKTQVEKIIHAEIALCQNKLGDFFLVAKSQSGRVLTNSLYEFSKSFDRHVLRKWLHDRHATDFSNDSL